MVVLEWFVFGPFIFELDNNDRKFSVVLLVLEKNYGDGYIEFLKKRICS